MSLRPNVKGGSGKIIATELEASKAKVAHEHWKRAGSKIENTIELREGDILRKLDTDMPPINFLLLDIWCVLVLPIVKLLHCKLRPGAMIVADNTIAAKAGYSDLMEYLNDKANGFRLTQAPYTGGLMIAVYDPQR
ncbi:hypothetical protein Cpir12675_003411 [Ceratocystis pirilliformis]|uniref:O-methyltransferase n=1 Tax=Ceratocystis pirilliformis TaxID=259994 RepID=A0ABR3Z2Y3_9PEZI